MKLLAIILVTTTIAQAKATRSKALYSAELQLIENESPRKMENAIISNHGVQGCLRQAILKSGDDFSVSFSGNLSEKGNVSDVEVVHPYDSLRDCLGKELPKLQLGEGASGPFKIEISRVRTNPPQSKTFLLDLNDTKKFQ